MKRRIIFYLLLVAIVFSPLSPHAFAEDFSDRDYWYKLCSGADALTEAQKNSCRAFMNFIGSENASFQEKLTEINRQKAQVAKDIQVAAEEIREFQRQADALNGEIAALNGKIADLNAQIAASETQILEMQAEIKENENDIQATSGKMKSRMVSQQSTMRLNRYFDILMGARSFYDFIRIANGLSDITDYDTKFMEELAEKIRQLNRDKSVLEEEKKRLESAKQEVASAKEKIVEKQNEKLALKAAAQAREEKFQDQMADLEASGNKIAAGIEAIRNQMNAIASKLNEVVASSGWTYPVPGAVISAGTWNYAGGGVHLGEDFAASRGTPVYAVGNGVILTSADGCGEGHLGNSCGNNIGGSWGGGNQVYLLTKINGNLYAVKYLHLLAGSTIAKGSIVAAGTQIGQVGNSGNTSGPHCHIEVFYLGSADNFTSYAQNWNGDLSFGCGWGSAALQKIGGGVPSRIRPESVFGG